MRCKRKKGRLIPWLAVILGALILAVLILPTCVWWFLAGAALLWGGVTLLRRS